MLAIISLGAVSAANSDVEISVDSINMYCDSLDFDDNVHPVSLASAISDSDNSDDDWDDDSDYEDDDWDDDSDWYDYDEDYEWSDYDGEGLEYLDYKIHFTTYDLTSYDNSNYLKILPKSISIGAAAVGSENIADGSSDDTSDNPSDDGSDGSSNEDLDDSEDADGSSDDELEEFDGKAPIATSDLGSSNEDTDDIPSEESSSNNKINLASRATGHPILMLILSLFALLIVPFNKR